MLILQESIKIICELSKTVIHRISLKINDELQFIRFFFSAKVHGPGQQLEKLHEEGTLDRKGQQG